MPTANIKVFLRVRPSATPSPNFEAFQEQGAVSFKFDPNIPSGEVNNTKTDHHYRFNGILGMPTTQDEVFQTVAKPVADDVLTGVNGTIFAYGQTGSGKTFTITGGGQRYSDRGLIPRTINYIFEAFRKAPDVQYQMLVSYLEVYNENGYDLLRDDVATRELKDLPKVVLREDENENIRLSGLSVNTANTEEDALNLLFIGDTNRVVAETPMNDASTRSHCLFIIWIKSSERGSAVVKCSKMHLVDLAGSERPSRTGVEGNLLKEAKYINLSLLYLEQVIVALHDRSKGKGSHIPYRNSMMTNVLRDSLGGNCKTTMIGCIATESGNINESISTCNFAQRVAQIQNNAKVNEELDPSVLISRLKREVAELKEEVRVARSGEEDTLTPDHLEQCHALVLQYVSKGRDPKEPFVCGSVERLRACFKILRDLTRNQGSAGPAGGASRTSPADPGRQAALDAEARKLKLEIAQRDQEIQILVQMLGKHRNSGGDDASRSFITAMPPAGRVPDSPAAPAPAGQAPVASPSRESGPGSGAPSAASPQIAAKAAPAAAQAAPKASAAPRRVPGMPQKPEPLPLPPATTAAELLLNPEKAFKVFTDMTPKQEAVEENKEMLKQCMIKGKTLGEKANAAREAINMAKDRLFQFRNEKAMVVAGRAGAEEDGELEDGPEELAELQEIDRLKAVHKDLIAELRSVKCDIDNLKRLLEQSRVRTRKEFEAWFAKLRKQASVQSMDDETKRELYEKVTGKEVEDGVGSAQPSPSNAEAPKASTRAAPLPGSSRGPQAASAPAPAPVQAASALAPAQPSAAASTGNNKIDNDISAFYKALGDLTK